MKSSITLQYCNGSKLLATKAKAWPSVGPSAAIYDVMLNEIKQKGCSLLHVNAAANTHQH